MNYSISQLEQLSGVSAHQIRIWERRYDALVPLRSTGNVRFYDDEQLKRLLSIVSLHQIGYKISKACRLTPAEIAQRLAVDVPELPPIENNHAFFVSQIISYALCFNERKVSELISRAFSQNGVVETYKFIIYPLLVRVGLMWLTESLCPGQEHFLSAIIRQKLSVTIENTPDSFRVGDNGWILFLPEDEDHDIGLLLASYLLRTAGHRVTYLGSKVPLTALSNVIAATRPDNLLFFMTRSRPESAAQRYVDQLNADHPSLRIFVAGNQKVLGRLNYPQEVRWLKALSDFEQVIEYPAATL